MSYWDYEIRITGRIKCDGCRHTEDTAEALRYELGRVPLGEIKAKVEITNVRPAPDEKRESL